MTLFIDIYREITDAYEVLSDPDSRRRYDNHGMASRDERQFGASPFTFHTGNTRSYSYSYTWSSDGGGTYHTNGGMPFMEKEPPSITTTLTNDNIDYFVKDNDVWIIEFYSPRCAPCVSSAPAWEEAGMSAA